MHWLTTFVPAVTALFWEPVLGDPTPKYNPLPPLREQARIQNAWTEERKAGIPALLKKHGVEAWVVRLPNFASSVMTGLKCEPAG